MRLDKVMEWEKDAEQLLAKAPVFVRPLVRRKVEEFARTRGATRVTGEMAQQAYAAVRGKSSQTDNALTPSAELIGQLEAEANELANSATFRTRHYVVQPCAGAVGCPRALIPVKDIAEALVSEIEASGFPKYLEEGLHGRPLLSHHRFHAAVSGCPNACSQPQIRDFGVIGAVSVQIHAEKCTECLRCVKACHEQAIAVENKTPYIDSERCLDCGDCVRACQFESLTFGPPAYRILVGGKLGRHPRLATEVARVQDIDEIRRWLRRVLTILMSKGKPGERVGAVLAREGMEVLNE